jgi:predicted lactoylglutathione lyase
MGFKTANIFVNLPVKDLNKSVEFFTALGFEFNAQFTDENATCLIIGENIYAMLLVEDYFKSFIKKEISDTTTTSEMILAISAENKEQVDELVHKAHAAGAGHSKEAVDHGFMYGWGFQDLDGHLWEVFYMDPSAVNPTE